MPDLFDRATEHEEWLREMALAAQAQKAPKLPPEHWDRLSARWCEAGKCGERIPDERRRAYPGVRFCVTCQAIREQQERQTR